MRLQVPIVMHHLLPQFVMITVLLATRGCSLAVLIYVSEPSESLAAVAVSRSCEQNGSAVGGDVGCWCVCSDMYS